MMVMVRSLESVPFVDIYVYVMYYVYATSGPSLLIESTDSMIQLEPFMWIGNYKITVKSALAQKRGHLRQISKLKIWQKAYYHTESVALT